MTFPSIVNIRQAATRLQPYAHRTPVLTCHSLDRMAAARLFFKCENLQKAGAFKFRGACNAVFSLSAEEAQRGVATHSSGNHAAAVALAAQRRGIPAHVVMPHNVAAAKRAAVEEYGAAIIVCEPTQAARESILLRVVEETGAVFIPPYNDARVIAGQGTAALELHEDIPELDMVLVPVGGGGLLSGTALALAALAPTTRVVGVEPAAADDAMRSLQTGTLQPSVNPQTIADGLRTSLGDLTFAIIQQHVERIVTVSEEAIVWAMRTVWERMKLIIEPSSAVPIAAVLDRRLSVTGQRLGIILTGGNVDLSRLPWPVASELPSATGSHKPGRGVCE